MNWIDIKKRKPIAHESGCWDGLRSSKILVCTLSRTYHVAIMYKGILDGSIFCDFYDDKDDCEIKNVEWWADIDEAPF
jgi:hypothetical protein